MPPRVLVADDDAWILRMVTTVLKKRGYEVETATDGEEAYERALANPPDLLVTDVMMPKMDGWSLVKALRSRPEFGLTPVIFLTALGSDDDRIRGFRLGADDYLPKPFRFEEFDLRVAKTLRYRQMLEEQAKQITSMPVASPSVGPAGATTTDAGITGDLSQLGLSSLLTILDMDRMSGLVRVTDAATRQVGRLFLRDGRIVRAQMDDPTEPENEECVYHLLTWAGGTFEFTRKSMDEVEVQIGLPTTQLLMEGARRMDERKEAERQAAEREAERNADG